jgi:serine/threonine protein kinase
MNVVVCEHDKMTRTGDLSAYKRASPESIFQKVNDVVSNEVEQSAVFDRLAEDAIPQFEFDELGLGKLVGRGGFCVVRDLSSVVFANMRFDDDASYTSEQSASSKKSYLRAKRFTKGLLLGSQQGQKTTQNVVENSREYIARRVLSNKGGKYVVKLIDNKHKESGNMVQVLKGSIDLVMETKFLAALGHPNILSLRATSKASDVSYGEHFIIVDKLQELLSARLVVWMNMHRRTKGITGFVTRGSKRQGSLLSERLLVAHDIGDAMDYLHTKRIIYRDLVRITIDLFFVRLVPYSLCLGSISNFLHRNQTTSVLMVMAS